MQSTQKEAVLVHCPDEGLRHSQSHCVRNDIGTYSRRDVSKISDKDRLWLFDNAFKAEVTYCYPHKEAYCKKHTFQSSWLCYSESCNGRFYTFCFLFAKHYPPLSQLVNPWRTCAVRVMVVVVSVCLSVCVSVCLLSLISPLGLLFFVKMLPLTQHAMKVKKFVAFSLKLCHSKATALSALYGYRAVSHFLSAEHVRVLLKCHVDREAGYGR